jgi:hypothetical protein
MESPSTTSSCHSGSFTETGTMLNWNQTTIRLNRQQQCDLYSAVQIDRRSRCSAENYHEFREGLINLYWLFATLELGSRS